MLSSRTMRGQKTHDLGSEVLLAGDQLFPIAPSHLQHSEEAERAVLASVLLQPEVWPRLGERLRARDFAVEKHQLLFEGMRRTAERGHLVDTLSLTATLEELGTLDAAGGKAYLHCLDVDLPDIGRIDTYIEIVWDRALRRRMAELCLAVARSAFDPGRTGREVVGQAEAGILQVGEGLSSARLGPLGSLVDETLTDLEDNPVGRLPELRCGLDPLDTLLSGLGRGRLVVLAGRPGRGKTSLALASALDLALYQGHSVAFFSLEMTSRELVLRLLGAASEIPTQRIASGVLSRSEWERLHEAAGRLRSVPFYLDDTSGLSILELASAARRLKAQRGLDAVVVDYLQLLDPGQRYQNENIALSAVSRALKQLAKELDVPVLVLSQLSRESERRGQGSPPQLSDLRGSGSIEQDADAVVFLWPPSDAQKAIDGADLVAIVAKNRHGETGEVKLGFAKETLRFHTNLPTRRS